LPFAVFAETWLFGVIGLIVALAGIAGFFISRRLWRRLPTASVPRRPRPR
jgi:predicted PurR-regulated permease PerM